MTPVTGRLVVPPGEGKLADRLRAPSGLRSQERIRFRYMLEAFDHEWTEALQRREAFYTNLPPGDYRFRVQAFEMNMPESVSEAALAIEWRPHFYRTAWFLALCAALLVAAGADGAIACGCGRCTRASGRCWKSATAWRARCTTR